MYDIPLPENFLDPFMPLDSFEWYDQNIAQLGCFDSHVMMWPDTMIPLANKNSSVPGNSKDVSYSGTYSGE